MANEQTLDLPRNVMASLRPLLLLLGVAAAVAAGVAVMLWWQGPNWSLLYGNLSARDTGEVVQALQSAGIQYKLNESSGAVMVPAEKVHDARLQLASQGLPESSSSGLDLVSKNSSFGVSQFMENARYQYAVEQELARTISSLRNVEAARVHLAVPQQSAFVRDRRPVSASVFLQLRGGYRLDREQVNSIVNLVASSIPELTADQVTVVDSQGRLLSAPEKDNEFAVREEQLDIAKRLEEDYSQRIESLLTPLLGPGRVRAQVVAQIEMSSSEEAREQYRPDSQIVRSEQTSEELSRTGSGPQGVPGALTNQPPVPGSVLPPGAAPPANAAANGAPATQAAAAAAAATGAPDNQSRQATRNYEIDRTVAYTKQPAGRLQRLSVAVLIDNLRTTDKDDKVTETPLTEEQLARINTLVRDAVGFDEKRGDRVSVVNQSFLPEKPPAEEEAVSIPLWERPMVLTFAKLGAGLLALLLLLLMVVKPLLKSLSSVARAVVEPPPGMLPPAGAMAGEGAVAAGAAAGARPGPSMAYEQQIAQARSTL